VEGRYPNVYVTSQVAEITDDKATYIKNRAFDDDYYKKMIIAFIKKYSSANRQDIDQLLMDKLSDSLNDAQKRNKIRNLLSDMSKNDKSIKNIGSDKKSKWVLV
jgi:ATP-dependent DNA helicase RecG